MMDRWTPNETRTRIYLEVRAAGERGVHRRVLMSTLGLSHTGLDWHLSNLLVNGFVTKSQTAGGRMLGVYTASARIPPIDGLIDDAALALIDDCPAGVSAAVLGDELRCSADFVQAAMRPHERSGRVERVPMPISAGGGIGWRSARALQSTEEARA